MPWHFCNGLTGVILLGMCVGCDMLWLDCPQKNKCLSGYLLEMTSSFFSFIEGHEPSFHPENFSAVWQMCDYVDWASTGHDSYICIYSYDSVPWQGWCFACWCSSFAWLVCSQRFTQGDAWLKPAKACWDCCLLMLAAFLASLVARGRDSPVKDLAPWPRQPSLCNIVYIW